LTKNIAGYDPQGVWLLGLALQPYSISLGMVAQPNPTPLEGVESCTMHDQNSYSISNPS